MIRVQTGPDGQQREVPIPATVTSWGANREVHPDEANLVLNARREAVELFGAARVADVERSIFAAQQPDVRD